MLELFRRDFPSVIETPKCGWHDYLACTEHSSCLEAHELSDLLTRLHMKATYYDELLTIFKRAERLP